MEENTSREPVDPAFDIPQNPPGEISSGINAETITPKQDTEIMEVHHHPDIHHKPKKLKEYFLEFIMIFLAVTMGFIAENIREGFGENERAKQYAKSLYDDLKVDTAIIQRTYNEKEWIQSKFDSAEVFLASKDLISSNEFIYYVERYVNFNDIFSSQDVTFQQLRNSGNFRYIKNTALYKNINEYYNLYSRYEAIDGKFGTVDKTDMSDLESKLFDPHDLINVDNYHPSNFYDLALRPNRKLTPLVNDRLGLNLLSIKINNAKWRTNGAKLFLGWLKARATLLVKEIKQEYKLE